VDPVPDPARMVRLTTVASAFEAKVLAARLGSEGVVCELRGGVDGPYPFGLVHVYVEEPMLDEARFLLVDVEPLPVDEADELLARALPMRNPATSLWWLVAVLLALLALAGASMARVIGGSDHRTPVEAPVR
jgi:hypothetical protein